jgi:hypothetical protein
MERAYSICPKDDVKLVVGDVNAEVERHRPTIRRYSQHKNINENVLILLDLFDASRQITIQSTYIMHKRIHLKTWQSPDGHTSNQIDHCLIDGRHLSDVKDVRARRGANKDSEHMLVVMRVRLRIRQASNMVQRRVGD